MITCRELTEFLDDYLAGELDLQQAQLIREHLSLCPDCVNYVESYRRSITLGQSAMVDASSPAPSDVPEHLLEAIRAARRSR